MHNSAPHGNMSVMTPRLRTLIDHAARLAETDAVLLRKFADACDPQAFAELVRRYGRLVWGQCRNLLRSEADADDAFQATFLALATAARTLRDAHKLGPWLHGVAYRVCQQVKRSAGRRAKREKATAKAEAIRPVPDSAWDQAFAAVHDELATLPGTLRVPFILCVLEGKGTTEAAAQLGLKVGTLSARLSRAKQTLLDRLTARGLTAGLATVGAVAVGSSLAPAAIVGRACDLAAGGAVPANILSLSNGALTMISQTVKRAMMAAVLACGLAAGVGGVMSANGQDKKPEPKPMPTAADYLKRLQAEAEAKRLEAEKIGEAFEKARTEAGWAATQAAVAARKREDEQPKRLPEFKYEWLADFQATPTTAEFEKRVKAGETDGYTFVGVIPLGGQLLNNPKLTAPALVFRRTPAKNVEADGSVQYLQELFRKQNAQPQEVPKPKPAETPAVLTADADKLKAEIDRLKMELADLKAKETAFRGDVVQFPLAHLAADDNESAVKLLAGMVRVKYGPAALKKVAFSLTLGGGVQVNGLDAEGNAITNWLFEQVKKMREG